MVLAPCRTIATLRPVSVSPGDSTVTIPARTERQAMDWSLVLTSQGIDVTIDRSGETGAWVLLVPDEQSARARETLKRFREENRGWSVRVRMPGTDARLHWGALVWVFALVVVHGATAGVAPTTAVFDTAPFRSGEWWRAWTATWLHADLAHLVMNCIFGGLLMGLAMGRYGAGPALGGALVAGAAANVAAGWIRVGDYVGLGASGVVMAALGMLSANLFDLWRNGWRAARWILPTLAGSLALFIELGTSPRGDVVVHALGFAAGIPAGMVAALWPQQRSRWLAAAGWAILFAAVAGPWGRFLMR